MLEQVSTFDQDIKFITGFAGSGKSTRLSNMATKKTLVMTPTHKAAGVLIAKGVQAYTIHSVLSLVPTINEDFRKGQRIQVLRKVGKTDLSDIDDIFIDEFSMINEEILDMLLALLPEHCKVTVFGDPYQLPPVSGTMIDPLNYTDKIEELTVQHRADNPAIVETFMRFMNYIKSKPKGSNLVVKLTKGDLSPFNPETDRALAYTNDKVLSMNAEIGKMLNLPEEISFGEGILVNDMVGKLVASDQLLEGLAFPGTMSKGKMMESSKFLEASDKLLANITKYRTDLSDYSKGFFEIDGLVYIGYYDYNHYEHSNAMKQDVERYQQLVVETHSLSADIKVSNWCHTNRDAEYVKERARAWAKYLTHQNLVFNIRRPFATTIHKAQGQEFERVFVAQDDIKRSIRNGYYDTYARLMYVALSRAINNVVIVS